MRQCTAKGTQSCRDCPDSNEDSSDYLWQERTLAEPRLVFFPLFLTLELLELACTTKMVKVVIVLPSVVCMGSFSVHDLGDDER